MKTDMKIGNNIPLIVLICVITFCVGVFDMIAALDILCRMDHSWTKIDLYCFLLSGPLLVLPLVIVCFNRRLAWHSLP